jgi:hypothetical protein
MRFGGTFTRVGGVKGKELGVRKYEGIETKQKGKGVIVVRLRDREAKGQGVVRRQG